MGPAGRACRWNQEARRLSRRAAGNYDGTVADQGNDFALRLCNLHKNIMASCGERFFLLRFETREARVGNGRFGWRSMEALGTMMC